ncbi:unnamed protein product, partial [Prorocentrum cordatum]
MSFLCGLQTICRSRSSAQRVDLGEGAASLPAADGLSKRMARSGSSTVFNEYLHSLQDRGAPAQVFQAGDPVCRSSASPDVMVVRGPDWKWGCEDGGEGKPGRILSVSRSSQAATVHWHATGIVESHYRLGKEGQRDLCLASGFACPSRSKVLAVFRGLGASAARNSQSMFAEKDQTMIVLDWDDTLFPSTYVRNDMKLKLSLPLRDQKLPAPVKKQVFNNLMKCAAKAERLLRLCASYGKVVIVTLAKRNWVSDSCTLFYPGIGDILEELHVKIVHAQDGVSVDSEKVNAMDMREFEEFWGGIKGRAISEEVRDFYSQYEGQSWKNVISIGDSNFEKIGTMNATAEYMRENGIEVPSDLASPATESGPAGFRPSEATTAVVEGHAFHVRTKVAKMLDEPTVEELLVELELVRQWLPLMVRHDGGFSLDLDGLQHGEARQG